MSFQHKRYAMAKRAGLPLPLPFTPTAEERLAAARLRQIQAGNQRNELRRMQSVLGDGISATAQNNKLKAAKFLATLLSIGTGGLIGYAIDKANGGDGGGAFAGAAVGGGAALGANILGTIGANLSQDTPEELHRDIKDIGLENYLIPGFAANLQQRLKNDALLRADQPQQLSF